MDSRPARLMFGLAAWTILFCLRLYSGDRTVWIEATVLLVAQFKSLQAPTHVAAELFANEQVQRMVASHMLSTVAIWALWYLGRRDSRRVDAQAPSSKGSPEMKPLVWPCRTTHTRLFPKKHSFAYSYLLVGVPVDWTGSSGSLLSSGSPTANTLFHVSAADHLDREFKTSSLRQKMDAYLVRMSLDPLDFPHAYLVTAPRCMGYCFNPVSFWYLYSATRQLTAMILEVNNTFDERRMYLLQSDGNRGGHTFSNTWQKDFHVSPFNDRQGSYILKATDPHPFVGQDRGDVHNDITLLASDGRPKLVARVFAVGEPLGQWPAALAARVTFLVTWVWVGLLTFPRIVWEAGKLYFRHALEVWFRPEVAPTSIGRQPTAQERTLETFFARFLEEMTVSAGQPLRVVYERPPELGAEVAVDYRNTTEPAPTLRLRVLSPAFYSRFVHYSHAAEAFDREFLCTDKRNRTVWIDEPMLLGSLLASPSNQVARPTKDQAMHKSGWLDGLRWSMLGMLRCPPTEQSYGEQSSNSSSSSSGKGARITRTDIRARPRAAMDMFAARQGDAWRYRRAAIELFTAQRLFGGVTAGIDVLDVLIRMGVSLVGWQWSCRVDATLLMTLAALIASHVLASCRLLL